MWTDNEGVRGSIGGIRHTGKKRKRGHRGEIVFCVLGVCVFVECVIVDVGSFVCT